MTQRTFLAAMTAVSAGNAVGMAVLANGLIELHHTRFALAAVAGSLLSFGWAMYYRIRLGMVQS